MSNTARALKPGSAVGIFSPSGSPAPARFAAGLAELRRRGYTGKYLFDPSKSYGKYDHGFACASVDTRLSDLYAHLEDDSVSVLLGSRGTFGALHLLGCTDWGRISRAGKLLIGYSDISLLLVASWARTGLPAVHGPTLSKEFGEAVTSPEAAQSVEALLSLVSDPDYRVRLQGNRVLRSGASEGHLIVGNLTSIVSLLGTPFDPSYDGAILVVEEVGEAPYRVERMMYQLLLSSKLDRLSGLVFGRFSRCESANGPGIDDVIERLVQTALSRSGYPILSGIPVGHNGLNIALPIGCRARIMNDTLETLESPVRGE